MNKEYKKKILHIFDTLQIGGAEIGMIESLKELNNNFDYILLVGGRNDLGIKNKNIKYLNQDKFSYLIKAIKIFLYTRKEKPDIVITSLWKSHFYSLILRDVPVIPFIHNSFYHHVLDRIITRIVLKKSEIIYCDSVKSKNFIQTEVKQKQIEEIPFKVIGKPRFKQKTFSSNQLDFFSISRITKTKKIIDSIKLIRYLHQDLNLHVKYSIYGDGEDKILLKKYVEQQNLSNIITFHGPISYEERGSVYKKHNFYLQSSRFEGYSMSVFESMIFGCVPIVFPAGEIPSYLTHLENGYLLDENDFNSPSKSLLEFISDNSLCNHISVFNQNIQFKTLGNVLKDKLQNALLFYNKNG